MFIEPQHPKANLAPTREVVASMLKRGWLAQEKINGRRLQLHIQPCGKIFCYTRQGRQHTMVLPTSLVAYFSNYKKFGYITLDAEWYPQKQHVYIFDILKVEGNLLDNKNLLERQEILKKLYIKSKVVRLVKCYKSVKACLKILNSSDPLIEGIVFKYFSIKGWPNQAILRCLKAIGQK